LSAEDDRDLDAFEARLGYRFGQRELLETALRHASRAHECDGLASNERLEFLGDAVVGLAVAHRLFAVHPEWDEGDLTRGLHALVDKRALAGLAERVGLAEVIELGRTEHRSDGRTKPRIIANTMEAVIGAVFLDGGLSAVDALVGSAFPEAFEPGAPRAGRDPKTELQELSVARWGELPRYVLVDDSQEEGADDRFGVEVVLPSGHKASAQARSKRVAEQRAARRALRGLDDAPTSGSDAGAAGEQADDAPGGR
jgi:ribonuclease-3